MKGLMPGELLESSVLGGLWSSAEQPDLIGPTEEQMLDCITSKVLFQP